MRTVFNRVYLFIVVLPGFAAPPAFAETRGVKVDVAYTGDVWTSLSGGVEQGTAYLDNLDISIDIDAEELWGLRGTHIFVYGLYNNGGDFSSTYVGDHQVVSNVETGVSAVRLYGLAERRPLLENRPALRPV